MVDPPCAIWLTLHPSTKNQMYMIQACDGPTLNSGC
uniref:DNA mismatch repair protein PMS1 n=1 Tax=Rhizophora mucronata TaxID=61149 RepID=A0A2P2L384_RHIMU